VSRWSSAQFLLNRRLVLVALILISAASHGADDFSQLCADRTAIERVYYNHRTGTKEPFEKVLRASTIENLVRHDLKMEMVLKKAYDIEVTPAQIEAEVKRINSTTRAPEILAELKKALNNDPQRFARTIAEPIVVERELRSRFENDTELHAEPRRQAERLREQLISAKKTNVPVTALLTLLKSAQHSTFAERSWRLTGHSTETSIATSKVPQNQVSQAVVKSSGGPYSLEGIASLGPLDSDLSTKAPGQETLYFEDLPTDLQRVLKSQLTKPGNASAVIETSSGFLIFVATETSPKILAAGSAYFPKRNFDEWVESISP